MYNFRITSLLFSILMLFTSVVHAETVYVTDELKIGLHKDATIDSPIIKLVPSGTSLTVIERNNELVHVEETSGTRGWINNKYVVNTKPGKSQISELEKSNTALKKEIESLKANPTTSANGAVDGTAKELEQQLNSERLKVGGLQAELADIKASIAKIDDSDSLLNDIETLKQENRQLISQLKSSGIEVDPETESMSDDSLTMSWKQKLFALLIVFILGMAGGAFVLDFSNRRRHGGFRV